ncbi:MULTISPECIES: LacI family DNA-binding transcriptional regulator [unclassified Aliivibrio]|uniref:LacI family DNA-binding transcriptional regulator n=1 Tax=unclassified Aliivibrio TaxID=2645654 RepID=UPI00080E50D0|nr:MULTISPECIES: LacI family DNA-binding transcriptional regulator [unclassified Aliivibrio]OCH13677.1 LacI family transcriptional regulator [Aliivibrio sp. 1S165]OCH23727.1 LacI family transcriptional regulator [Aliivibrio sp. 1S128]OCH31680.1 LacI family transcriptional regulator [Aliivibrio sp. 1S175]
MTVTFKDVAKLAGVSTQTVSRVTNGSINVSENTRVKVNKAIKQLGYIPNKSAQMLSRSKSNVIGLITLEMSLHGAALIANGIRLQAHDMGYGTVFSVVDTPCLENIQASIHELISQQATCIILNIPLTATAAEQLVEQYPHLHFVFIDVPEESRVHYVCCDHQSGAQLATQHLLDTQHQQFLLITGPQASSASMSRYQTWLSVLEQNKLQPVNTVEGNWQANSGYLAVRETVANQITFDAVLVANDQMALGVLRALNELGLTVPSQVSVIGFDDINDSAYFTPPLTTVKQHFLEIGKEAVIIGLRSDEQDSSELIQRNLDVAFVQRQSTAPRTKKTYQKENLVRLLNDIKHLLPDA